MVGPFFMPIVGVVETVSHLLPLGFSAGCHSYFKRFPKAFGAGTRTPSGLIFFVGGTLPRPRVLQTLRNRVRVARVERACMVCHVWCVRAAEGRLSVLVWHNSSCPIVCVVLHEVRVARVCAPRRITQCLQYRHCSERWFASVCLWGGGSPLHLVCAFLAGRGW